MQSFDFQVNVRPGATSLSDLKEINAQLERMIELQKQVNSGGGFGPGRDNGSGRDGSGRDGGGRDGGGGDGSGTGSGSSYFGDSGSGGGKRRAASAAGLNTSSVGSDSDPIASAYSSMAGMDPSYSQPMTHEQRHAANLRRWQMIMGIQSLGYGVEDMYYSGARGVLNNLPFMAQGAAAMFGVPPGVGQAVAGITALAATSGLVAYENREGIAGSLDLSLGTRAESMFGTPEVSATQKAQKKSSDAMYYVGKYGDQSAIGRRYLSESIDASVEAEKSAFRDIDPNAIARIRSSMSPSERGAGESLKGLGLGTDYIARRMSEGYKPSESELNAEAQKLFKDETYGDADIFSAISNRYLSSAKKFFPTTNDFTEQAGKNLNMTATGVSQRITEAMSGNPDAIRSLKNDLASGDKSIPASMRQATQDAVNLSGNLSSYESSRIQSLQRSAAQPFANVQGLSNQIGGMLSENGASNVTVNNIMNPMAEEMQQQSNNAPRQWQKVVEENQERWVSNIAASLGGIRSNSRGRAATQQTNNLKQQVYYDLVNSGVPPDAARALSAQLFAQGQSQFQSMYGQAGEMRGNGMSQMQNFMYMMGEEQQMAFGQMQQSAVEIQMQRSALRQMGWQRSRFGLRGVR